MIWLATDIYILLILLKDQLSNSDTSSFWVQIVINFQFKNIYRINAHSRERVNQLSLLITNKWHYCYLYLAILVLLHYSLIYSLSSMLETMSYLKFIYKRQKPKYKISLLKHLRELKTSKQNQCYYHFRVLSLNLIYISMAIQDACIMLLWIFKKFYENQTFGSFAKK